MEQQSKILCQMDESKHVAYISEDETQTDKQGEKPTEKKVSQIESLFDLVMCKICSWGYFDESSKLKSKFYNPRTKIPFDMYFCENMLKFKDKIIDKDGNVALLEDTDILFLGPDGNDGRREHRYPWVVYVKMEDLYSIKTVSGITTENKREVNQYKCIAIYDNVYDVYKKMLPNIDNMDWEDVRIELEENTPDIVETESIEWKTYEEYVRAAEKDDFVFAEGTDIIYAGNNILAKNIDWNEHTEYYMEDCYDCYVTEEQKIIKKPEVKLSNTFILDTYIGINLMLIKDMEKDLTWFKSSITGERVIIGQLLNRLDIDVKKLYNKDFHGIEDGHEYQPKEERKEEEEDEESEGEQEEEEAF